MCYNDGGRISKDEEIQDLLDEEFLKIEIEEARFKDMFFVVGIMCLGFIGFILMIGLSIFLISRPLVILGFLIIGIWSLILSVGLPKLSKNFRSGLKKKSKIIDWFIKKLKRKAKSIKKDVRRC